MRKVETSPPPSGGHDKPVWKLDRARIQTIGESFKTLCANAFQSTKSAPPFIAQTIVATIKANRNKHDTKFMRDLDAATSARPALSGNMMLFAIGLFIVVGIWWSAVAEIDQVTIGSGQVIPSSQIQVIQNLEGGILAEMLVQEGNRVEAGQILMRLDDTDAASKLGEDTARYLGLSVTKSRLEAEVEGRDISIPTEISRRAPHIALTEMALFKSRINELSAALSALAERKLQKGQEIQETKSSIQQNSQSLALSREEIEITRPMVERGITSRVELLQLERSLNDLQGKLNGLKLSLPKTEAALREAEQKYREAEAAFRSRALKELNETQVKLNSLKETMTSGGERVNRTEIRSPVTGTVKRIYINTVGGVIQPGMSIMEIVPIDEALLLDAQIIPSDIAGIHPGQQARVKISAYDYTIHGALDAKLEHISADTITDEEGKSFYLIRVRTTDSELISKTGETLPIIPGMTAQVDILTGTRTVLEYIMKPILRARELALREK